LVVALKRRKSKGFLNNRTEMAWLGWPHQCREHPHSEEITMRFSKTLMLSALVVVLGSSATIAQTAPAAKSVAGQSAPAAKPADPAKQAISKACSD
jgi:hypothetical protein